MQDKYSEIINVMLQFTPGAYMRCEASRQQKQKLLKQHLEVLSKKQLSDKLDKPDDDCFLLGISCCLSTEHFCLYVDVTSGQMAEY